mmetsp:Transcript_16355/g.16300  ORF Transcript_16355/g.16300 Transcript_16355/m.16300 type:complete len:89 (-) Transcript_16355:33-299(-)
MQLSNDGSGEDDDGLEDDTKVLSVFLLNFIFCVICCGMIQGVMVLSKKMNSELNLLRKNYKQYQGYMKFREFRKAYADEQRKRESENN